MFLYLVLRTSNVIAGVRYFVLPDDAMISMRFARNYAVGLGLVWNDGERVQGFTNPAWTMIMAVVHLTRLPSRLTPLPMQLASVLIHLLTATYIWRRVTQRTGPSWGVGAATAYLSASCAACWAISGWETSAVTLGWALALDPVLNDQVRGSRWRSLLVAGVTTLFRPDAVLLLGALAAYWVVTAGAAERGKAILAVLLSSVPVLALAMFQHEYYGSWIPNTGILKRSAGFSSIPIGVEYVLFSLSRYPFNGVVLVGAMFGAARLRTTSVALLALLGTVYLVYVVSVGGDAFPHARFLLPLLPTATILAVDWMSRISNSTGTRQAFLLKGAAIALIGVIAFDFADEALVAVRA
jgi:hypothetical protein